MLIVSDTWASFAWFRNSGQSFPELWSVWLSLSWFGALESYYQYSSSVFYNLPQLHCLKYRTEGNTFSSNVSLKGIKFRYFVAFSILQFLIYSFSLSLSPPLSLKLLEYKFCALSVLLPNLKICCSCLVANCTWLFVISRTVAHQAPSFHGIS